MERESYNRKFLDLTKIYPDDNLISQNYEIYKKKLTQEEVDVFVGMNTYLSKKYSKYFVVGEEHVSLYKRDEGVMMSTHQSETMTNQDFINQAYGDVLIFGLGLGMIIFPLLEDENIKSITVIEHDAGVIDMVGKIINKYDTNNKLKIVHGDAFEYCNKLDLKQKFDTIYFDIWIRINEDSFCEMEVLHDLYKKFKREENSYLHSWCYEFKEDYLNQKSISNE